MLWGVFLSVGVLEGVDRGLVSCESGGGDFYGGVLPMTCGISR